MSEKYTSQDWREGANCAQTDPELMFPEKDSNHYPARKLAIAVCENCVVRTYCLQDALSSEHGEYGIWGGMTENARRDLKNRRPRNGRSIA